MIKCKQAENSECGKSICCFDCEKKETCGDVCSNLDDFNDPMKECEEAFEEKDELAVFETQAEAVIKAIADIASQKKTLEENEAKMREQLEKYMDLYNVKSFENDIVKITYVEPTTKNTIDSKALKKDFPDIAAKYSKTSAVKGSVRITVK